jgi:hypothetical protein
MSYYTKDGVLKIEIWPTSKSSPQVQNYLEKRNGSRGFIESWKKEFIFIPD